MFIRTFRLCFYYVNFNVYFCRNGLKIKVKQYFAITTKARQDDK